MNIRMMPIAVVVFLFVIWLMSFALISNGPLPTPLELTNNGVWAPY